MIGRLGVEKSAENDDFNNENSFLVKRPLCVLMCVLRSLSRKQHGSGQVSRFRKTKFEGGIGNLTGRQCPDKKQGGVAG
jgi:hypothetical protein